MNKILDPIFKSRVDVAQKQGNMMTTKADVEISLNTRDVISLIGVTRTGKTANALKIAQHFIDANVSVGVVGYFADGKRSQEYANISEKYSECGVIYPRDSSNATLSLDNILTIIQSEILKRDIKFKSLGVDCFARFNHESIEPLPYLLLLIDELQVWNPGDLLKLNSLAENALKYGLKIIGVTQRSVDLPECFLYGSILVHKTFYLENLYFHLPKSVHELGLGQFVQGEVNWQYLKLLGDSRAKRFFQADESTIESSGAAKEESAKLTDITVQAAKIDELVRATNIKKMTDSRKRLCVTFLFYSSLCGIWVIPFFISRIEIFFVSLVLFLITGSRLLFTKIDNSKYDYELIVNLFNLNLNISDFTLEKVISATEYPRTTETYSPNEYKGSRLAEARELLAALERDKKQRFIADIPQKIENTKKYTALDFDDVFCSEVDKAYFKKHYARVYIFALTCDLSDILIITRDLNENNSKEFKEKFSDCLKPGLRIGGIWNAKYDQRRGGFDIHPEKILELFISDEFQIAKAKKLFRETGETPREVQGLTGLSYSKVVMLKTEQIKSEYSITSEAA